MALDLEHHSGITVGHGERGRYLDEKVADAPEAVGDAGLLLPQPVVVRNADVVHVFKEGVLLGKNQFIQALGARLLHALQTKSDVNRDFL